MRVAWRQLYTRTLGGDRPASISPYLSGQHLLLGLDLLLLAGRHFLKLGQSQIQPGAVHLHVRTQRTQLQDEHRQKPLSQRAEHRQSLWELHLRPSGHN